jgi:hypothetical protein
MFWELSFFFHHSDWFLYCHIVLLLALFSLCENTIIIPFFCFSIFFYPLVLLFMSLGNYRCLKTVIEVDAISMVHRNSKVVHLYTVLVNSLWRNLKLIENSFLEQISNSVGSTLVVSTPEPYHFLPRECGHFVTVVYPKKKRDFELGKH